MIHQSRSLPHRPRRPHAHRNSRAPTARLALNSHHHPIPVLSKRQTGFLPFLKVLGCVDRAAYVALGADRPVLREGGGADDGGRVDAPFAPDFVGAAVAGEGAVAGVVTVVGGVVAVAELWWFVRLKFVVGEERIIGVWTGLDWTGLTFSIT